MARDSAVAIPPDELIKAYGLGYFPMARARDDENVVWILPDERGVLPLDRARAPKRLLKFLRRDSFEVRIDSDFPSVINACAEQTRSRPDTWINDAIIEAYTELFYLGRAHSVECWNEGQLVGGLYGVTMGAAFCGESMFSRETNASKIAFLHLIAHLKLREFHFIDAQFTNNHLTQFGLIGMPNKAYQKMLAAALKVKTGFLTARKADHFSKMLPSVSAEPLPETLSGERVSQLITHTS